MLTVKRVNLSKYICAPPDTNNYPSEPLIAAGRAVAPSIGGCGISLQVKGGDKDAVHFVNRQMNIFKINFKIR